VHISLVFYVYSMGASLQTSSQDKLFAYPPLLWLDKLVNRSQDNLDSQKLIRSSIDHLKTFDDVTKCEDYIRSIPLNERVLFIVSGRLGREIIPRIHHCRQISSIYIYCLDKSANEQWAKSYKKVTRRFLCSY